MKRSVVNDIVQPITTALGNDKQRVSMALAIGLGFALPQPSTRLQEKPEMVYISEHMTTINRFVSDFNERFLINVTDVAGAVKTIWCTRYNMLYARDPATLTSIARGACPIKDFLSGYGFDDATNELVISAGIASLDRLERALETEETDTSDV